MILCQGQREGGAGRGHRCWCHLRGAVDAGVPFSLGRKVTGFFNISISACLFKMPILFSPWHNY